MPNMRAKFRVIGVNGDGQSYENLKFMPVTGTDPFGPNGESEDNTYARYTPSGSCELSVTNPALIGQFKEGDTFYVDFTPAEK